MEVIQKNKRFGINMKNKNLSRKKYGERRRDFCEQNQTPFFITIKEKLLKYVTSDFTIHQKRRQLNIE